MDIAQQLFTIISNPNVAYLALIIGLLMLVVAVTTPGTGLAEVIAIMALAVAAIGLVQLEANLAGVVLIIAAFILFALDVTQTAHGALTLGGAIALFAGSLLLFPSDEDGLLISPWLIGAVTLLMVTVSLVFLSALLRWRKQHRVDNAAQTTLGQRGVVKTAIAPLQPGTAQIAGQLWSVSADSAIAVGVEVEVVERDGLTLKVKPLTAQP
jgi:membrane-bound serine protease (ClpP class)